MKGCTINYILRKDESRLMSLSPKLSSASSSESFLKKVCNVTNILLLCICLWSPFHALKIFQTNMCIIIPLPAAAGRKCKMVAFYRSLRHTSSSPGGQKSPTGG